MKKVLIITLILALCLCSVFALTACSKDKEQTIDKIEAVVAKNATFKVGDKFDTAKIVVTAYLSDETTKVITNNLVWDKSNLKLDSSEKFTTEGTYEINISFLKYKDIKVSITVVAK